MATAIREDRAATNAAEDRLDDQTQRGKANKNPLADPGDQGKLV
jgi:hypothetical protein